MGSLILLVGMYPFAGVFASTNLESCECVAFRLDDIQDYFLTNAQMKIIDTFEENSANLTVGIIGNLFGEDRTIVSFINSKIAGNNNTDSNFAIEIANHGWNHEDFRSFSKDEQSMLMQRTNNKIVETLGVNPIVFITPYNRMNDDTIAAMQENGLQYVSANTTAYAASFLSEYNNETVVSVSGGIATPGSNITIYHFPSSAHTGDLNADNTEWAGYSHERTFADLNASMNDLGYAVVTMHPQEFSVREGTKYQNEVDEQQISELELLLKDIRQAGFKIVTISQIDDGYGSTIPEFPAFSVYAILAVSIIITVWLTTKWSANSTWH
jgi:peptidoglycan/xylan/chitin deacetylase (PgdA/CDA1 family)